MCRVCGFKFWGYRVYLFWFRLWRLKLPGLEVTVGFRVQREQARVRQVMRHD